MQRLNFIVDVSLPVVITRVIGYSRPESYCSVSIN